MSLSLLQGYSSDEDGAEFEGYVREIGRKDEDEDEDEDEEDERRNRGEKPRGRTKSIFDHPKYPSSSGNLLPSAFEVFSEIAGPPEFLNKSAGEMDAAKQNASAREGERKWRGRGGGKSGKDKKDLPAGVVVEAKAQLTGIRDRVRSDVEGRTPIPPSSDSATKTSKEGARLVTALNPEPSDAAELLRMCVQCGIPKTYSHSKGMVCPVCSDRPHPDPNSAMDKKKGSTIKDKEKSKRMKGQSSHASWKSETEMHLRQQFD